MSDDIFDELPEDINDKLINDFEEVAGEKLTKRKRHVWRRALQWAFQQDVSYLTAMEYAELIWEDKTLRLKFKEKLFDKFNSGCSSN